MPCRTLYSERHGFVLHLGMFVHVHEDKGRDRGKSKVYMITKFHPEDGEFEGSYWEQPRYPGSSLHEHDFDAGDHLVHKMLPEIVHTPEIHLMDLRIIESKPVFHFHWSALVSMDDTPVGIDGAYVFGRKITRSKSGLWSSKAVDPSFSLPFWERTQQEVQIGAVRRNQHMWETFRLLGETIRSILLRATPGEWSDSDSIGGFDDLRWHYLAQAHPAEPSHHIKDGGATKVLKIGADMAFFKRAVAEEVHSMVFRSDQELKALTRVLGRFWNIAPYKTQMPKQDRFRPHLNMNIKAIHPRISTADVALVTREPAKYRRKKRKEADGTTTTGSECRRPGVYLSYTKESGRSCGSLSVALSWHDKIWQGRGWVEEVEAGLMV